MCLSYILNFIGTAKSTENKDLLRDKCKNNSNPLDTNFLQLNLNICR